MNHKQDELMIAVCLLLQSEQVPIERWGVTLLAMSLLGWSWVPL